MRPNRLHVISYPVNISVAVVMIESDKAKLDRWSGSNDMSPVDTKLAMLWPFVG